MQDSTFLKTLTVREALYFVMKLRLLPSQYEDREDEIIGSILDILNLRKVQDSVIGDPEQRGISGGELRRLSIGVEMVVKLLCDADLNRWSRRALSSWMSPQADLTRLMHYE